MFSAALNSTSSNGLYPEIINCDPKDKHKEVAICRGPAIDEQLLKIKNHSKVKKPENYNLIHAKKSETKEKYNY